MRKREKRRRREREREEIRKAEKAKSCTSSISTSRKTDCGNCNYRARIRHVDIVHGIKIEAAGNQRL